MGAVLGVWSAGCGGTRRLLACCVRLSLEKEPQRFVALAEALQRRGALARHRLTPLLCASATGCVLRPSWAILHAAAAVQTHMCTVTLCAGTHTPFMHNYGLETAIILCTAPMRCSAPLVYAGLEI